MAHREEVLETDETPDPPVEKRRVSLRLAPFSTAFTGQRDADPTFFHRRLRSRVSGDWPGRAAGAVAEGNSPPSRRRKSMARESTPKSAVGLLVGGARPTTTDGGRVGRAPPTFRTRRHREQVPVHGAVGRLARSVGSEDENQRRLGDRNGAPAGGPRRPVRERDRWSATTSIRTRKARSTPPSILSELVHGCVGWNSVTRPNTAVG